MTDQFILKSDGKAVRSRVEILENYITNTLTITQLLNILYSYFFVWCISVLSRSKWTKLKPPQNICQGHFVSPFRAQTFFSVCPKVHCGLICLDQRLPMMAYIPSCTNLEWCSVFQPFGIRGTLQQSKSFVAPFMSKIGNPWYPKPKQ